MTKRRKQVQPQSGYEVIRFRVISQYSIGNVPHSARVATKEENESLLVSLLNLLQQQFVWNFNIWDYIR
jgi:hypothetical protein